MTENRLKSRLLMGATLVGAKIIRVRDAWATRPVWVKMTEAVAFAAREGVSLEREDAA